MKALLLNGPPRAGKDTVGRILLDKVAGMVRAKFAAPIIDFMFREHGILMSDCEKDSPHTGLYGRTPREAAIAYSEKFCKPLFGQHYFGYRACEVLAGMARIQQRLVVFTDSGFVHEAIPVLNMLGKGNVLQVRLQRPGHNFTHDSRSYWDHPDIGSIEFDNDCPTVSDLRKKVNADLVPEIEKWLAS